jgi:hypothetical protein
MKSACRRLEARYSLFPVRGRAVGLFVFSGFLEAFKNRGCFIVVDIHTVQDGKQPAFSGIASPPLCRGFPSRPDVVR